MQGSHRELSGARQYILNIWGTQSSTQHLLDIIGTTSSRKFSFNIGLHDIPFNNIQSLWSLVFGSHCDESRSTRQKSRSDRKWEWLYFDSKVWEVVQCEQAHIYHYNLFWLFKNEIQMFSFFPFVLFFFQVSCMLEHKYLLFGFTQLLGRSIALGAPWKTTETLKRLWMENVWELLF